MSYKTIKDGIVGILRAQGYQESGEVASFENVSALEYGKTFIIQCDSGEMGEGPEHSENLNDRFYDIQKWRVQLALSRSSHSDTNNRDALHLIKDTLITQIDKPTNWVSYARIQKYNNWIFEELKSYFLLTIEIKIIDQFNY